MEFGHALWRKSSFSGTETSCVEVAYPASAPRVGIRDSKNPGGGHLTLRAAALHHLVREIRG